MSTSDCSAFSHWVHRWLRRARAACLCCAASVALADDKPVMTWMVLDLPPSSILVNDLPTDGATDIVLKLIADAWPEVEHRYLVVNTARAMANLGEGVPACFSGALITPERERIAYFSPTSLALPLHLVVRGDALAKIPRNAKGEVLAATLFDRSDLRGLMVPQRSYSPTVDALLHLRSASSGIRYVTAADNGANILKMLQRNRGDYTLEYDAFLAYQQSRNPELREGGGLYALPLAGSPAPAYGGIGCPRTAWGHDAIEKIDSLLTKLAPSPAYQNAMNRWLTPETIKRYQGAQAEFFRQRAKAGDAAKYPRPASPP